MLKDTNLVEKSKPLVWARFNNYSKSELKILEVYLSRINARDPESSNVVFTKKEYCDLMGLNPEIKTSQLKKYTQNFLGNVVTIDTEKGYVQYALFSDARCELDDDLGQVVITTDCNPKLKDVFFNIAEDGYIRYKLRNVINLNSQYSIRLYSLLKDKAFGSYEWVADLKELRKLLGATESYYDSFKEFNRKILKRCEEEINGNTDIRFEYEKVTRGRLTRAVKFKIKQLDEDNLPGQMNIYDYPEAIPEAVPEEPELTLAQQIALRRREDFRDIMEEINPAWKESDERIDEMCALISEYLLTVPDFYDAGFRRREIMRMNYYYAILRRARAEQAKYLYKFFVASWPRWKTEVLVGD